MSMASRHGLYVQTVGSLVAPRLYDHNVAARAAALLRAIRRPTGGVFEMRAAALTRRTPIPTALKPKPLPGPFPRRFNPPD